MYQKAMGEAAGEGSRRESFAGIIAGSQALTAFATEHLAML